MVYEHDNEQCRLCLSSTSGAKCIYTTEDDNKISLATKIMVCTSLVVTSNDDKPQYLCPSCEETLESFFEFRNKCLHSHFQLCFDSEVTFEKISPYKNVTENQPSDRPDLQLELKQEREEAVEKCDEKDCDNTIDTLPTVPEVRFIDNDFGGVEQRMECANCLNGFYSLEELDDHWNSCGASKYKSEELGQDLTQLITKEQTVDSHENIDAANDECGESTKINCDDCVKLFMEPKLFSEHLLAHSNGKRYNCHECSKTFIDHYELKYHMRIHFEDDRYKCKECGKIFARPSSLRRHILIHNRKKPYKCKYCSKTFPHRSYLLAHERIHTGETLYKCQFCSKSFYECSAKIKHEKNHVKSNKMFQCDICNRMFATHKEMDEHFNSHDSQMVWKCKTCKQEFRKPLTLKTHSLKCHNDELPFQCEICSECFALQIELKAHINIHTDDIICD